MQAPNTAAVAIAINATTSTTAPIVKPAEDDYLLLTTLMAINGIAVQSRFNHLHRHL